MILGDVTAARARSITRNSRATRRDVVHIHTYLPPARRDKLRAKLRGRRSAHARAIRHIVTRITYKYGGRSLRSRDRLSRIRFSRFACEIVRSPNAARVGVIPTRQTSGNARTSPRHREDSILLDSSAEVGGTRSEDGYR